MKCPLCGDNMVTPKLSPGCLTHEHQTQCPFVWNDLTEEQMDVLRDAALGRALRRMKAGMTLWCHAPTEWGFDRDEDESVCVDAPTPKAALQAAGLMEAKG